MTQSVLTFDSMDKPLKGDRSLKSLRAVRCFDAVCFSVVPNLDILRILDLALSGVKKLSYELEVDNLKLTISALLFLRLMGSVGLGMFAL